MHVSLLFISSHCAGPLLLNALLQYLSAGGGSRPAPHSPDRRWPGWLPDADSAAFGCWCAALLGLTSAAKARVGPAMLLRTLVMSCTWGCSKEVVLSIIFAILVAAPLPWWQVH